MKPKRKDSKTELQTLENTARLGCGAFLGVFLGLSLVVQFTLSSFGSIAIAVLLCMAVCAWLSLKFGDRFWHCSTKLS
mgnify:CR=1 FL=1